MRAPPLLPGSTWADLTFSVILKRILSHRDALQSRCRTPRVPWHGTKDIFVHREPDRWVDLTDVAWADDISSCLAFRQPEDIRPEVMNELGVLSDSFQHFGMKLNYGATKTAILVSAKGAKARSAREQLFSKGHLVALRENSTPVSVPLVARYRQVGVVCPEGSMQGEVRQRVGEAWAAFRQARRKLFRKIGSWHSLRRSLCGNRWYFPASFTRQDRGRASSQGRAACFRPPF